MLKIKPLYVGDQRRPDLKTETGVDKSKLEKRKKKFLFNLLFSYNYHFSSYHQIRINHLTKHLIAVVVMVLYYNGNNCL